MATLNKNIKQQFLDEFGKNLRAIRKQKDLTQVDLALKINGDESKIGRIERGLYDFRISSLLILAKSLEIKVEDLFKIENLEFLKKHIWE